MNIHIHIIYRYLYIYIYIWSYIYTYVYIYTHKHTQEVSSYCSTPLHTLAENYNFFQSTLAHLPSHTYFCKHTSTHILLHTYFLTLLPDAAYQIGSVHVIILELPITSRDTLFAQRKEKKCYFAKRVSTSCARTHTQPKLYTSWDETVPETHTRKHTHTQTHARIHTRIHDYQQWQWCIDAHGVSTF